MLPSRVLIVDTKLSNINSYLTSLVQEGFEAALQTGANGANGANDADGVVVSDYHRAIRDAERLRPDFILCFDGQQADALMIEKLRRLSPRLVLWLTEDPYERTRNAEKLDAFDLVFTNDVDSVAFYRDARVHHLPLAASPTLHDHPVLESEAEYLYDVFFAGVAWPNRVRFLRRLRARLRDLRVRTILPHNEFLRPPNLGVPAFEVNQRLGNGDIAFLQNRSRVVLHLDRDFSASGDASRSGTPGPRLFETAMAGAFQLADASGPSVAPYFEPGREIALFQDDAECERRIRHFLAHAEERKAIARAARARAKRQHLYEHRARTILEKVAGTRPRAAPVVSGPRTPTVLYVAHNSADRQPFGGTELHMQHTRDALPPRFRSAMYYPDRAVPGSTRLVLGRTGPGGAPLEKFITIDAPLDPLAIADPAREEAFARVLEQEQVDVVHFLHLMNHPPTLVEVARRHGARTVVTMPDFFALCPRFTLMDAEHRFCWNGPPPLAACDIDLERTEKLEFGSQARRRAAFAAILGLADVVTCLSQSQADIVLGAYPHLRSKLEVIRWGIDRAPFAGVRARRSPAGERLTVAALGNFTRSKGAEQLLYLLNFFRDDPRVRFKLIGRVDAPYGDILRLLAIPNLEIVGEYGPGELPRQLEGVDVALLASVWAETFVLALSEAWAAGVVPIVTDIGALGERVTDGVNGLKVPPASAGHLAHAVQRLIGDRALLERLREGAGAASFPSIEQTTTAYVALYDRLLGERGEATSHVPKARARKLTAGGEIPSSLVRVANRWGWTPEARPDVPTHALLSRRHGAAAAALLAGRLSSWTSVGHGATITVDPQELDGDDFLGGSEAGPSVSVTSGHVRAVKLWGDARQPRGDWQAVECRPERAEAGLSDWLLSDGSDPQLVSPELDFDWGDFDGIMIAMAAHADEELAGGQIFFSRTHAPAFSEASSVPFVVRCDGWVHRYVIRPHRTHGLRQDPWIRRLRFDPVDVRGSFYVESIVLFSDRPRLEASAVKIATEGAGSGASDG